MNTYTRSVTSKRVHNVHTNRNGGFLAYFKLTIQIWKQFFGIRQFASKSQQFGIFFLMSIKTPYWIFIKPLFIVFSTKSVIKGEFQLSNGRLSPQHSMEKSVTYRFLNIPFFFYKAKLNKKDWKELLTN
jgi:hypothetical protein